MESGCYEEALGLLNICDKEWPMLYYYRAECLYELGKEAEAKEMIAKADAADSYCCFPNRLEDIKVLELAMKLQPEFPKLIITLVTYGMINASMKKQKKYGKNQQNWTIISRQCSEIFH